MRADETANCEFSGAQSSDDVLTDKTRCACDEYQGASNRWDLLGIGIRQVMRLEPSEPVQGGVSVCPTLERALGRSEMITE